MTTEPTKIGLLTDEFREKYGLTSYPGPIHAVLAVFDLFCIRDAGMQNVFGEQRDLTREDILTAIGLMTQFRAEVDAIESSLISEARKLGVSWTDIGHAYGYPQNPRQNAYARAVRLGADRARSESSPES